jgi:signal transduction histidine kinase
VYRDLHRRIALSFTAIVCALLVISGLAYIGTDFLASRSAVDRALQRRAVNVLRRVERAKSLAQIELADDEETEPIALIGPDGLLQAGVELPGIESVPSPGFSIVRAPWGTYRIYAARVMSGPAAGSMLVMEQPETVEVDDLGAKIALLLAVIVGVSVLTYLLGSLFAGRILGPVAENLERLEQFTADAGHELRTPLAAASASLDAGLRTGDVEAAAVEARSEVMRAGLLVDRLLELARLGRLTLAPETTDLSELVRKSIERHCSDAAGRGLTIESAIAPSVTVLCDPALVGRVIDNLIENALVYAYSGTSVSVALSPSELAVADQGPPLPSDQSCDIFEPFVQGDSSRSAEGFGLGLALVRQVVELHGWTVSGQSEGGEVIFTVRLRPRRSSARSIHGL